MQAEDSHAPLLITCWPTATGGDSFEVNLEYELNGAHELRDVSRDCRSHVSSCILCAVDYTRLPEALQVGKPPLVAAMHWLPLTAHCASLPRRLGTHQRSARWPAAVSVVRDRGGRLRSKEQASRLVRLHERAHRRATCFVLATAPSQTANASEVRPVAACGSPHVRNPMCTGIFRS
eukprot:scaffold207776_cov32-Tisochrysis_lutea.AAC.6